MRTIRVAVIGAGHAGLGVSRLLTGAGIDHVVLDRGLTAQRWRTRGWDSLHLLSPRWMARLPGYEWRGHDPHGYMTRSEFVDYLTDYAASFAAPVVSGAEVLSVRRGGLGLVVTTTAGSWTSYEVVLATGHCDVPAVPELAESLPPDVVHLPSDDYRNPAALPGGGVLVVGASASGVQVADELASAGREVVLAVGAHSRLPRRYRGRDILAWLDDLGAFDRGRETLPDPDTVRDEPSMQLSGNPHARELDLASLQSRGVELTGRLVGVAGARAYFAPDLVRTTRASDARLKSALRRIDVLADAAHAPTDARDLVQPANTVGAATRLDLRRRGIRSVVWATGYRRPRPWLQLPVLGADGEIRQHAGRTAEPGLFVVGTAWQTRRSSGFIDGTRHDAELVAAAIAVRAHGARDRGVPAGAA